MRTRAAILDKIPTPSPYAVSRPLRIDEVLLDDPGPEEVLVQIGAAGLCHSDLSVINGTRPRPTPMALGHEAAGTVVEVGSGISDLSSGDRVVMTFQPACGRCVACAQGYPTQCASAAAANGQGTLLSGAKRIHDTTGCPIHHHCGVSAFAEYAVVSRRSLVRVDADDIPFAELALFGCAVQTGVGAVFNTCGLRPGESVAIIGLGGVGLAALLGARAAGASQIIAIDLADDKLTIAAELGADRTYNARDPDIAAIICDVMGGGVDHAIEVAGAVTALELAFAIARRGGQAVAAGLAAPGAKAGISAVDLVGQEKVLKGSYMGSCVPQRDIPRFIDLYRRGLLPVNKLLTGTIDLDGINEGFDVLERGEALRQVITM